MVGRPDMPGSRHEITDEIRNNPGMAATQCLAARILLDVYNPVTRKISIGEFGFLRARQRLEVCLLKRNQFSVFYI
jgi:hypothetical protein